MNAVALRVNPPRASNKPAPRAADPAPEPAPDAAPQDGRSKLQKLMDKFK